MRAAFSHDVSSADVEVPREPARSVPELAADVTAAGAGLHPLQKSSSDLEVIFCECGPTAGNTSGGMQFRGLSNALPLEVSSVASGCKPRSETCVTLARWSSISAVETPRFLKRARNA